MPCLFFRTITRDDLVEYVSKHYSAPRMVLAAAGGKFSLHVPLFTMCTGYHSIVKDYMEAQELDSFNVSLELLDNCQQRQCSSVVF